MAYLSAHILKRSALGNSSFFNQLRGFSAIQSVAAPSYRKVPFAQENMEQVMREVPNFQYYYVGNANSSENPFKDIPLDQAINMKKVEGDFSPHSQIQYSVLENGLKIASLDRGGLASSLGLFVQAGSRHEDASNYGVSHMIQTTAFSSTAHLSMLRTIKTIEVIGANAGCVAGREHTVYSAECLRDQMPLLVPLLTGNVLFPRLLPWELKSLHDRLLQAKQRIERTPEQAVSELLHSAAWHNNTLGNKVYATERSAEYFNADTIREFMLRHFSADNMVFVGVNVNHDDLCKWLMRSFVDYNAIPSSKRTPTKPVYTGGDIRVEAPSPHTHIAIAFETKGGWNGNNLVVYSLLQSIMGGGGAFSTGGPGKGMYTRLYTQILNKNDWVESAMAFNTQYTDSGLFGLYILGHPDKASHAIKVLAEQFAKMSSITSEELNRAKNALKTSIYMNLECRGIAMEDIGRQLLMSGKVISPEAFAKAIDEVSAADIKRAVDEMLKSVPTVVGYGDVSFMPHYEEIKGALRSAGVGK